MAERPREDDDQGIPEEFALITDPDEAIAWLNQNGESLSSRQLQLITEWLSYQAQGNSPEWGPVFDVASSITLPELDEDAAVEAQTQTVAEQIVGAHDAGQPMTRDEAIAALEDSGLEHDAAVEAFEAGYETAESVLAERGDDPQDLEKTVLDTPAPDWVLAMANQLTNGPLTEAHQQRILEYWNTYYSPDQPIETFEDLVPLLEDASRTNQYLIESALLGDDPELSFKIALPGGRSVVVSGARAAAMREQLGIDVSGLTRLARLTGDIDVLPQNTSPNGDPVDQLLLGAAIARGYGWTGALGAQNERDERIADMEEELEALRERKNASPRAAGRIQRLIDKLEEELRRERLANRPVTSHSDLLGLQREGIEGERGGNAGGAGIQQAMGRFRQGLDRYNDELLAMLYVFDEGLAYNIHATGGDPTKLSVQDELRAIDILQRTMGESEEASLWTDLFNSSLLNAFRTFASDRGGGASGRIRRMIDPVGVAEQYRQLYQQLFLAEPSEEEIAALTKNLQAQLDAAPEGMDFDIVARIQDFARGSANYAQLYANKPGGLTELEYQGQMAGGVQDVLGDQLDPEAVRAGMETGSMQTAIGQAVTEQQVFRDNSTWLGRLAGIAQTVERFT